jgi:hypothetical protein
VLLILPDRDTSVDGFTYVANISDVVMRTSKRRFRVAICVDSHDKLGFEYLCRLAYVRGDCTFAVDELHEYCPNVFGAIPKYFKKLCLHGRHRNVAVIGVSQRPANVHKDFFSQAHRLHVFRTIYPGDLDALKRIVPDVEKVKTFKVGQYVSFP